MIMRKAINISIAATMLLGAASYLILFATKQAYLSGVNFEPHSVHFAQYPFLMWMGVISNIATGIAFVSIPIALSYFVHKRADIRYSWVAVMFSSFIFWCALHHFVHAATYWYPIYGVQASVDFVTAGVSTITSILLWRVLPHALKLPRIEEILNANKSLESRVAQRTQELEKREAQFRDLANSMPQLVWTADPEGKVDYYNKQYKNYLGINKKDGEFVWAPVVHPEDAERTLTAWNRAVKTGETYEVEHRIKTKDDGYRWLLSRGTPVKDKTGSVVKWYGTATDIHKSKQLERQKDEFLSVASHELKTPVTSIKAYTQVLQRIFAAQGEDKAVQLLGKMDGQINKLTVLIGDLLDATKIESGKLKMREEYFDFNGLVQEVVEEIQRTAPEHRIIAKLSETRQLFGDRDRIGQVIVNFLTNAVKYSPNTRDIYVQTKLDGRSVTLSVKDRGIGIPREKMKNLFERFYRVEGKYESTYPGLGLGLYISKEIIERQGGTIAADSEKGKGSTFSFTLPLRKNGYPLSNSKNTTYGKNTHRRG